MIATLGELLADLQVLQGLACEDCGRELKPGEAVAAPLPTEKTDARISRIDFLCEACLANRSADAA